MSALPPIADIRRHVWHVRFVPLADIPHLLFDKHLVGEQMPALQSISVAPVQKKETAVGPAASIDSTDV